MNLLTFCSWHSIAHGCIRFLYWCQLCVQLGGYLSELRLCESNLYLFGRCSTYTWQDVLYVHAVIVSSPNCILCCIKSFQISHFLKCLESACFSFLSSSWTLDAVALNNIWKKVVMLKTCCSTVICKYNNPLHKWSAWFVSMCIFLFTWHVIHFQTRLLGLHLSNTVPFNISLWWRDGTWFAVAWSDTKCSCKRC